MSVLCCFLQLWRLLDSKLQTNTASSITDTFLDLKLLPFSPIHIFLTTHSINETS